MVNRNLSNTEYLLLQLLSSSVHGTEVVESKLIYDEWIELLSLTQAHNVLPLVFEKAIEIENFVDTPIVSRYMTDVMSVVAGQARRTEAFLTLYKAFLKVDIHPIVMKGLICRQLYGEYCDHRPSGDEDILILKSEYEQVQQILQENGYRSEYHDITDAQLDDLQEVTFYSGQTGLSIEVHLNPIGHEDGWRRQLNDCFRDVFQNCREEVIDGVPVMTMSHTDHMLFLILHAFKHLTVGGFGIRQVIDILLYAEKYGAECDWKYLYRVLKEIKANSFFIDLIYIGNQYLGFNIDITEKPNCPEELLKEILDCGIFGNATQVQRTAVHMTSAAMRGKDHQNQSRIKTLLYAIFPDRANMLSLHPELQEKPWLLPICWIKRWGRFLAHNKANGGNLAAESMKISKRRIELLKKYDIL